MEEFGQKLNIFIRTILEWLGFWSVESVHSHQQFGNYWFTRCCKQYIKNEKQQEWEATSGMCEGWFGYFKGCFHLFLEDFLPFLTFSFWSHLGLILCWFRSLWFSLFFPLSIYLSIYFIKPHQFETVIDLFQGLYENVNCDLLNLDNRSNHTKVLYIEFSRSISETVSP